VSDVYDVYLDECKEGGYWHGFFFVPRSARQLLLDLLKLARTISGYPHEVHYIKLGSRIKPHYETAIITQAWTSIGVAALQQQKLRRFPPKMFLGRSRRTLCGPTYRVLSELVRCKFVVFRERDNHKKMYSGMTRLQCIETTFRMGLKGGVHLLFDEQSPVIIGDVFIDGDEQYLGEFGRTFDINRTLVKFDREKRPYVSFSKQTRLIPQRSDPARIEAYQSADDSEFLQLCDILIGGVRFHSQNPNRSHIRYSVRLPCRELLSHEQENLARMQQSRFYKGFMLSEAWLDANEWHFARLRSAEDGNMLKPEQSCFSLARSEEPAHF